ncbi:BMP family lipoprotein [Maridesulfovibrio zosterae]|uniref:BMP family lipoprotein n=1 Tax=Maridesulfovibrio zosterae TaxID=82171 RepID=UPI0004191EF5|nr:BMP family ABC transporter substrate-binding protein [Maridesulfovibrio zosterae]
MKKYISAILITVILAGTAYASPLTVGFVTGSPGLGDLSYNDMSYGGVRKAQQEFKFKLIILEPEKNGETTEKDFLKLIKQCDAVILIGIQHAQLVKTLAPKFPEKKFILLEIPLNKIPNVSSVEFKQEEGSFLAGALAAYMSKTGKIGFIGGTPVPPVLKFQKGYVQGAKFAVPDIDIEISYVSPIGDFSGFNAPDKGNAIAMNQYADGADIIFTVAGLTGNGVIEAARRNGKYAIGVDSDQDSLAKGFVLTSMIKKLDMACYEELKALMKNRFNAGPSFYGLKENGVGLSKMKYTRDKISDQILNNISIIKNKIINGKITIDLKTDTPSHNSLK